MPYRFKLDEDVRRGFRRIAREQVDLALSELNSDLVPPASVHASRKAMKRLRALVCAAAPAMGLKTARKHDKSIRDIARLLSQRRDADVCLDTLCSLETYFGAEAVAVLRPLRAHLSASAAAAGGAIDAETLRVVRQRLTNSSKRLEKLQLTGRGLETIAAGIELSYRAGRTAHNKAYRKPSDENFHDLRKSVQVHWRQMALLSRAWPEEFAVRVAAARELSQLLGDDHDLAILKLAARGLSDADQSIICKLCQRRQIELRTAARARAERLYCEKPSAFGSRMKGYWKAGRRIKAAAMPALASLPGHADATGGEPSPPPNTGSQPRLAAKTPATAQSQRRA